MFNWIKKLTKSKNPNSKRYRYEMAQRISGHHVKYVTERINDVDEVIGRSGSLNVRDDELLVYASFDVLMRCKIVDMQASELLSGKKAPKRVEILPNEVKIYRVR